MYQCLCRRSSSCTAYTIACRPNRVWLQHLIVLLFCCLFYLRSPRQQVSIFSSRSCISSQLVSPNPPSLLFSPQINQQVLRYLRVQSIPPASSILSNSKNLQALLQYILQSILHVQNDLIKYFLK